MAFNPLDIPNREFASLFRAKINANFASVAAWINSFEATPYMVRTLGTGIALPVTNVGPVWHDDYASVLFWRTIGAYTGYASANLGTVAYFDVAAAPTGWLECNGQATPTRAALNALRGSSTLRDLRGEFIRGWDNARGVDVGRGFGTAQAHDLVSHAHVVAPNGINVAGGSADGSRYAGITGTSLSGTPKSTDPTGGSETRPRNVALMPCIKF